VDVLMKIYCSRIPEDYGDKIRWLVGKDMWVKVRDDFSSAGWAWYRFIDVEEHHNKLWITVNRVKPRYLALNIKPETKKRQLYKTLYVTDRDFTLVQPLDMLTTEEMIESEGGKVEDLL
jgi:hypothetical protein